MVADSSRQKSVAPGRWGKELSKGGGGGRAGGGGGLAGAFGGSASGREGSPDSPEEGAAGGRGVEGSGRAPRGSLALGLGPGADAGILAPARPEVLPDPLYAVGD